MRARAARRSARRWFRAPRAPRRPRLAQEPVSLLDLLLGKEDLIALIDLSVQQARATHPSRSHAAAEVERQPTLQRVVEHRGAVGREAEAVVGRFAQLDPVTPVA